MNQIRSFSLLFALILSLSSGFTGHGQGVWEKKPYHQWTRGETFRIITESPWSKYVLGEYRGNHPVNIRLHSALPIRQALVRLKQLGLNYDKLAANEKAEFDAQAKDFLECPGCAKYYIVTFRIRSPELKDRLALIDSSVDELKSQIFLTNDKGERRDLVNFIPPSRKIDGGFFVENAVFFFERFDGQGKPLITTDNKRFALEIDEKFKKLKFLMVKKFTFEVSKLINNGEISF